ncbi:XrtA/PEP-CTERM system-associated ATPase [Parasphingorhabdus sp. JC815]|uniref:XrtA/PEP-CTERM system-associated ATPase n=1 Tax=Parasphingorhabdus sp. JC815 TaxID=3232140 RepID=UPI003459C77E
MYETFYGLKSRPFQLTPDPHYYYESLTHRKALSYLGYGLAQGEGFIVITGDVGAGKTTLVSHLMATIDRQRLTAANIVTTKLDSKDIVRVAANHFDIDTEGMNQAQLLNAFEEFLHNEARAGRRCLLIVDESQNLPTGALEELRMLSNFQLGGQALLQIFLLGQPEFRDMLQQSDRLEQLRQRVIAHHHLDPMEAHEVEPYITHRLSKSGWSGSPKITSDIFALLYDETKGVPRKINTLMSRVMLMGAVEHADLIDQALVRRVLADLNGEEVDIADPENAIDTNAFDTASVEDISDDAISGKSPLWKKPERKEPAHVPDAKASEELIDQTAAVSQNASQPDGEPVAAAIAEPDDKIMAQLDSINSKLASLESRMGDHEQNVHRVLTMLVDWVENDIRSKESYVNAGRAA